MFESSEISEEEDSAAGVWLSIGDLMSGLMFFFALLFIAVLAQLQDHREQIVTRRTALVQALTDALQENHIEVEANEDGEIVFKEEMLFTRNSARLSPQGVELLRQFGPIYAEVIFSSPEFTEEVSRIVLEGHTSSEGQEMYNLGLSLRRAQSVAEGLFADTVDYHLPEHEAQLKNKLYPAGRGPWDASEEVKPSDRKVVLRIQFRGQDFLSFLQASST
ncbi:MAG: OmpA family protein [Myxococcota bacterium]